MKKPVAIIFANLKGNVGDFAILDAMARDLRRRYPDREVHVFAHGHLTEDRERLAAFVQAAPKGVVVAGKTNAMHVSVFLKLFGLIGLWTIAQRHALRTISKRWAASAKKFADYHAIFVAGGAQWRGRRVGMGMAAMTKAISLHNPRIYGYPFGLNPDFARYTSPAALRETLSLVRSPLVVRDGLSLELVEQLGLPVVQGADCVFSLQEPAAQVPPRPDRDAKRIIVALTGNSSAQLIKALRPMLGKDQAVPAARSSC